MNMQRSDYEFDFAGKRVTVLGLGRFGGGIGAVRFLASCGAEVTVTDLKTEAELADSILQIADCPEIKFRLGEHCDSDFATADLIVVSPAVPPTNGFLQIAQENGVPITTEISLFWQRNRGKVIAVTGSVGKSTTTSLIHSIVQAAGLTCWLGGNIGKSLLSMVEEIQPSDYVILELSSFQLFDLDRISAAPDVAVVTNFSPNHLDWHGSIENYRHAKQTILRRQSENQTAILNADDADVSSWKTNAIRIEFGQDKADSELELAIRDSFKQPGAHNFQNALAACCAANAVGIPLDAIKRGLQQFQPLEHRLQFVAEVNGRRFYNDSKATTPESAIAAIESFDSPVVLLAGGYDKQIDLAAFANTISQRCKAVALMGETATELDQLISADINSQICESFEDSFRWAVEQSNPGDVVLLSPGCASYDWFPDFEARGNQFVQLVGEWTDGMPSA